MVFLKQTNIERRIRTFGPPVTKGVPFWRKGSGEGYGDDKRRSRDGEYVERDRGFESASLHRRVLCEPDIRSRRGDRQETLCARVTFTAALSELCALPPPHALSARSIRMCA